MVKIRLFGNTAYDIFFFGKKYKNKFFQLPYSLKLNLIVTSVTSE